MSTTIATNATEKAALLDLQIPEMTINFFQEQRKGLGIPPLQGFSLYGIGATIAVVCLFIVSVMFIFLTESFNFVMKNPFVRTIAILVIIVALAYGIYYYFFRPDKTVALSAAAVADFTGLFKSEPFQNPGPVDPDTANTALMNLSPLTQKQIAYIGPKEDGGLFDLEVGLQTSIINGIRSYVLQISGLEVSLDPTKFAPKGEPTLVFRNDAGKLISANGASLKAVAQKLADYAFNEQAINNDLPLILYLHFVRTPDPIKKPEEYVNFLSLTAAALEPLFSHHFTGNGQGAFTRQQGEMDLLRMGAKSIGQKVIIMTNADTALFRRLDLLGMPAMESKYDLDYLTHLRVYAETTKDVEGVTGVAPSEAAAVLVNLRRVLALPEKEKDAFAQMSKKRFVIAMPSQIGNPRRKDVETAMMRLGVNMVPINLFGADKRAREELKNILGLWPNDKFVRTRPPALQTL